MVESVTTGGLKFRSVEKSAISGEGGIPAISTRNFDVGSAVEGMAPPMRPLPENFALWKLLEKQAGWNRSTRMERNGVESVFRVF